MAPCRALNVTKENRNILLLVMDWKKKGSNKRHWWTERNEDGSAVPKCVFKPPNTHHGTLSSGQPFLILSPGLRLHRAAAAPSLQTTLTQQLPGHTDSTPFLANRVNYEIKIDSLTNLPLLPSAFPVRVTHGFICCLFWQTRVLFSFIPSLLPHLYV